MATSQDGARVMVNRVFTLHQGLSVDDILAFCHEHGLAPQAVTVTGGHLRYQSPQTEEEAQRAAAYARSRENSTERWERETYTRLKAKFEQAL